MERERTAGGTWAERIRREGQGAELPPDLQKVSPQVREEVLYRVLYHGYWTREQRHIEKLAQVEQIRIPASIDYLQIRGLRRESALKLAAQRPATLGQASRISGVNPADISILMVLIKAGRAGSAVSEPADSSDIP